MPKETKQTEKKKTLLQRTRALGITCRRNDLTWEHEAKFREETYYIDREGGVEKLSVDAFGGEVRKQDLKDVLKGIRSYHDPCKQAYQHLTIDKSVKTPAIAMLFELDAVSLEMYRCFCDQIVMRMKSPGCEAPHILILKGREGIGKTMLTRHLACGWLAKSSLRGDRNDVLRLITGNLVCEVAELNFARTESSKIKDIISSTEDQWHEKYRVGVKSPRRCVFVGTTNEDTPLPQDTDGRRYWIIDCQPSDRVKQILRIESGIDQRKAWAQMDAAVAGAAKNDLALAKQRLESGETALLSLSARQEATERYRVNTYTDDGIHNLLAEHGDETLKDVCQLSVEDDDGTLTLFFTLQKFTKKLLDFTVPIHTDVDKMEEQELRRWREKQYEKLDAPSRRSDITAYLKRMGCKAGRHYTTTEQGKKKRIRGWVAPSYYAARKGQCGTQTLSHGNTMGH